MPVGLVAHHLFPVQRDAVFAAGAVRLRLLAVSDGFQRLGAAAEANWSATEAAAWDAYLTAVGIAEDALYAAEAAAWATYESIEAAAAAAAEAALEAAWDAFEAAEADAWATYEAANNAAWASYESAEAAASEAWEAPQAAAWDAYQAAVDSAEDAWTAAAAAAYAAYEAAEAAAWADYEAAEAAAWAAFEAALEAANAAWDAAEAAARAAAEAALDAAWAAYEAAEAAAWAAYLAALDAAAAYLASANNAAEASYDTAIDAALAEWLAEEAGDWADYQAALAADPESAEAEARATAPLDLGIDEEIHQVFFELPPPGLYDRKVEESPLSLAIGTNEDTKNWWATLYNQLTFGKSITLDKDRPDWDAASKVLRKLKDGSLKQIVISGHGSRETAGAFTMDDLKEAGSKSARFLELLGKKAAEDTKIELRACHTAAGERKDLIKTIAKLTKRDTMGYDDYYGPGPHGQQYIAKPDGTTVEEGKTYPPFRGTWAEKFNRGETKKERREREAREAREGQEG